MQSHRKLFLAIAVCLAMSADALAAEAPYQLAWTRQLGAGDVNDISYSVAVDSFGNTLVSGYTSGSLGGSNAGGRDAFLAKYDTGGGLIWTQQLGTSDLDESHSVAVDGAGNAFISGYTHGSLGDNSEGGADAFLSKYNPYGDLLWTQQLGTASSDRSYAVAIDGAGNAFISGVTFGSLGAPNAGQGDSFLAKYNSTGSLLWS